MRIGQFIDTDTQGGAETVVADLCRELNRRGQEGILLHFGNPYLSQRCRRLGVEELIVPAHDLYKSTRTLPRFALALRRFLKAQDIDLLHSHLYGPITGAAPAAFLAGIPHVGTLHDVYVVAERPLRRRLLQLATLLGTRLVAVSEDMARFYQSRAGIRQAALRTIYNGVSTLSAGPSLTRRELGIAGPGPVVICVGRLVPLKCHDLLLRAFARLPDPDAQLLLAGDGPLRQDLECTARELGLAPRVRFLGNRDDVPALLAGSDLFVLASSTEGLSCSVLEAMAAGLPVVATQVGGNPELVADGETGLLVAPGDEDGLVAALGRLLAAPEQARMMGERGRERAQRLFSTDAMLEGYLRLYREFHRGGGTVTDID